MAMVTRINRLLWRGVAAATLGCVLVAGGVVEAASELEVKAAFIYNFIKFVHWPSATFEAADELVLCVFGDALQGPLERIAAGKKAQDKRLSVRTLSDPHDAESCHVLFISSAHEAQLGSILDAIRGRPVLTVGEIERFALRGGIIGVFVSEHRVRFEINAENADRAGLQISSQLLKLATNVIAPGGANAEP
jgi:hypothetical protein